MTNQIIKQFLIVIWMMIPFLATGQWSNDPKENMTVFYGNYPKTPYSIAATKSGNVYIAWKSKNSRLLLQLFDKNGYSIWENKIQIPINHSIQRIDIKVDNNDNAVLFLKEYENTSGYENFRILLRKIDTTGKILWGIDGPSIELPFQNASFLSMKFWIHKNNSIIITYKYYFRVDYQRFYYTIIRRIRSDGSFLNHGDGIVLEDKDGYVFNVFPVAKDDYIIALGNYIGTHHDDYSYEVFFRRLNKYGEEVWEEDKFVYSGFVDWSASFYPGNNNDFYYILRSSRVQRMSIKGFELWEPGGVNIIQDSTASTYVSRIAGISSTGNILLFFTRKSRGYPILSNYYCQSVSLEGERLIGEKGRIVFPGICGSTMQFRMAGDTAYLFYQPFQNTGGNRDTLRVMGINIFGDNIWNGTVDISNSKRIKGLPRLSQFINNQAVAVWVEEKGNFTGVVKAQNIFTDGTLGIRSLGIKENKIKANYISGYDPRNNSLSFNNIKGDEELFIFNTQGKLIFNSHISGTVILPDIQQGVYIIKILRHGKVLETKKMFLK